MTHASRILAIMFMFMGTSVDSMAVSGGTVKLIVTAVRGASGQVVRFVAREVGSSVRQRITIAELRAFVAAGGQVVKEVASHPGIYRSGLICLTGLACVPATVDAEVPAPPAPIQQPQFPNGTHTVRLANGVVIKVATPPPPTPPATSQPSK